MISRNQAIKIVEESKEYDERAAKYKGSERGYLEGLAQGYREVLVMAGFKIDLTDDDEWVLI